MRLDKFLKVSRLIKRRTVANEACDAGRVLINDKPAKAGTAVKEGDIITIQFGSKEVKVEVLDVAEVVRKEEAKEMYRYMENGKNSVTWNFTTFPSQAFKDDFGAALLEYCNGNMTWDEVKELVVTRWAEEKAATAQ